MKVCTVVTRRQLGQAQLLAESLTAQHGDQRLHVLVVDDPQRAINEAAFDAVWPDALDLVEAEFLRLAACYQPDQLRRALKPWALLHALSLDPTSALYLDPDMEITGPLDELATLAAERGLLLLPIDDQPPGMPQHGEEIYPAGCFDAGFVGVGPDSESFLEWWRSRLARFCIEEPGYFGDQRWLALAPSYFPYYVLRRKSTLERWALPFARSEGRASSPNGQSSRPWPLTDANATDMQAYGHLASGEALSDEMRSEYRRALVAAETGFTREPPNPLTDNEFTTWFCRNPRDERESVYEVPASIVSLHQRRIQETVGMTWTHERAYCHWHTRQIYAGAGDVVDLGSWMGSLTSALAMGLIDNPNPATRDRRVYAYDQFRWLPQMDEAVVGTSLEGTYRPGDSFRAEFDRRTRPWADLVETHEGDLATTVWDGGGIEFLIVDAMKSWGLANGIVRGFFPSLLAGRSHVLHQDFAHAVTYWIHLITYRLRDYFELAYEIPWSASVVLRVVKQLPSELLLRPLSLEDFDRDEIDDAFLYSRSLVSDRKHPAIAAAKVMALLDHGDIEQAERELSEWRRYPYHDAPDVLLAADELARSKVTIAAS